MGGGLEGEVGWSGRWVGGGGGLKWEVGWSGRWA